ncbi:CHAT domain-containing protein [Waterburya agarophytonicola K14]|uniref:CHAT domain-containing protein n=1 Tax=Waterburya agarophytonicola KI4 TaxID=2874699 RepID=A0A964BQX2_9CYAN|nr:CHAT domain-containing protein [Waterburya agarophytonicola]MCC0178008.1 CHAT domain-containing protein [Waterburya agarophytonicola KI4]
MPDKFRQRCLLWLVFILLGLSISLFPNLYGISPGVATEISVNRLENTLDATELEKQGKYYYSIAQFDRAINSWQQAYQIYLQSQDILGQGRVLSNLALAYSQLNHWQQATQSIADSLELLDRDSSLSPRDKVPVLAQVWNNRGILEFERGEIERAIASWQRAKVNYQLVADDLGVIRASINQSSAFKELGFYHRAVNTLREVEQDLTQQPDSSIKATGLRSYGDILRLVGQVKRSQEMLTDSLEIVKNLDDPSEEVKTAIALGNTYKASNPQKALEIYHRGLATCSQDAGCLAQDLSLQVNLATINLLSDSPQWQDSQKLITPIQDEFARLPNNRANIDRKVNFAHALMKLNRRSALKKTHKTNIPNLSAIDELLKETIEQAKAIDYQKAQSYSWGLRGQIKEELQSFDLAKKYTQQALILGQRLNAPEIVYLWQWQLGRINKALGELPEAITHYSRGVELLKSLSQDLVAIDPDVQYSFREGVEPVYRQLVSLLLTAESGKEIPQGNLERGREVIESLQLAELNNFFREACLDAQVVNIDSVDNRAAVIYPIILGDRLEVILSLPDRPLQHYATDIDRDKLEATIDQFRQSIVVRSRRHFYDPAKQLYDLLIRPALKDLTKNKIETLVFVPDGSLRNIPLGALYDGKQYLIENYNVALTPGLQLLAPRPIEQVKLKTIAVGLTQSRQGFSALDFVNSELEQINDTVDSVILVDREFTSEALKQEIQHSDYPIVHIATHGQFSSSIEDTFLLAWDDRIDINQLDNILQTRNLNQKNAIELLVLSACETATGDNRAALGLAGMAVRAGARSTLATLWSVNDRATTKLMSDFYHELSDNHLAKADAVRQAQLSLLHSPGYEHPFYWAPYVLLGNWL